METLDDFDPPAGTAVAVQKIEVLVRFLVAIFTLRLVNVSKVKGILHQKKFCRLNLIFWIVMGCGIAHFARRGLKTT